MQGKRGLVMGVANDRSIAWGIAQTLHEAGAELAFSYQGEVFKKRVVPLVEKLNPAALIDCDVSDQASIDTAFAILAKKWDRLDFLVHSIAFAHKDELKGSFVENTTPFPAPAMFVRSAFVPLDASAANFDAKVVVVAAIDVSEADAVLCHVLNVVVAVATKPN